MENLKNLGIRRIFLDLDEVLADFAGAALKVFGVPWDEFQSRQPLGVWDITLGLSVSHEEFWRRIDMFGARRFWSQTVRPLPWLRDVVALAERTGLDWLVATSPPLSPDSCAGKVEWMNRHLGNGGPFRRYVLTPCKEVLAYPGSLLIDDSESNCEKFRDGGGHSILFPSYFNRLHEKRHNPVSYLKEQLDAFQF